VSAGIAVTRIAGIREAWLKLRPVGAVDRAVVEASGRAHHRRDLQAVIDDVGPLFARADRHDHALGRVDDGLELLDAIHPHIAQRRGAALILLRLQLAVAR
jgi:hypothetical protein